MKKKWVGVITRDHAQFFDARNQLLIADFVNELGREHNRVLTYDKPGVSRSRFAGTRHVHAMTGEKNPHEDAAIAFARKVCRFLSHELSLHRFEEVILVAEPKMLGRVRQGLTKHVLERTQFRSKGLGPLRGQALRSALRALIVE